MMPVFPLACTAANLNRSYLLLRLSLRPCCGYSDSSSSEGHPFNIDALAMRLGISRRKVVQGIQECAPDGMKQYAEDDHIPKSDAEYLALHLGLSRMPPPKFDKSIPSPTKTIPQDVPPSLALGKSHRFYAVANKAPLDAELHDLRAIVNSGDIGKLQRELKQIKYGFAISQLEGKNIISAFNGRRFPLHSKIKQWDQVVDGKALLSFVAANMDAGKARCPRCKEWFDTFTGKKYEYRTDTGDCLGYCETARRVGTPA
mmetsp:Transcript_988/g.1334  ORF Transcript_988/g.1334 Transcript_988/m.1334 type:complete len:258 (+) Transcript_988:64-837(+)